jgi:hypothetical protein
MKTHTQRDEAAERRKNRPLHADPEGEARKEARVKERHETWRQQGATSDAESGEDEDTPIEDVPGDDESRPVEEDLEGDESDEDSARRHRDQLAREEDEDIE